MKEVGPFNLFTDKTGVYPKENEMSEARQVPLPDLLRGVPRTKGLNIEEPNCTHHIPIGILAHEAADLIESQAAELAALRQADQQAQPVTIRPPFQREITVIMRPERGAKEADDAIDCIKKGGTVFIIDPPELYFHQLRLRVAQDPSLERRIAVFYLREDQVMQEVGLKFEDELLWPVGFLQSGWETETKINAVRQRVTSPPAPQHERDQRVIAAAEKMRYDYSEQNRAEYDKAKL